MHKQVVLLGFISFRGKDEEESWNLDLAHSDSI